MRSIGASLDLECGPLGFEYDDQVGYALIVVRIVLEDEAAGKALLDPRYESALIVAFEHGVYPRIKNYAHGWPWRHRCRHSFFCWQLHVVVG